MINCRKYYACQFQSGALPLTEAVCLYWLKNTLISEKKALVYCIGKREGREFKIRAGRRTNFFSFLFPSEVFFISFSPKKLINSSHLQ